MLTYSIFVVLLAVLALPFYLIRPVKTKLSHNRVQLGLLEALKAFATAILHNDTPNYETAMRIQKQFGDFLVVPFPFRRESLAAISDLSLAKKIMNSSEWLHRVCDNHYLHGVSFKKPLGLLFGNGNHWKEARRVTMKILHQLSFYRRNIMEEMMAAEIEEALQNIKTRIAEGSAYGSVTFCPHHMLQVNILNIMCQVIMGRRFRHGDPFVEKMLSAANVANREFNAGFSLVDVIPWLRHIPKLTFVHSFQRTSEIVFEFFKELMAERRRVGTYQSRPSDLVDYFLLEIDKQAKDKSPYITDESFLVVMRDMLFAGVDSTNAALEHGIMHMVRNPHVQHKVQAEIDRVIGTQRDPTYSDKDDMPYTEAVILEILRHATPVPVTSRSPVNDSCINGVNIAKGSLCGINLYAIHRSENLWEDPLAFHPERFLDQEGQIMNADKILPFGYGKRNCIGESVARASVFLFFTSLMQRFMWEASNAHPPPSLKGIPGLSRCPIPFYVTLRHRS